MTYSVSSAYLSDLVYQITDTTLIGTSYTDTLSGTTWVLKDFINDPATGYQGAVFANAANQVVLANRGTEPSSLADLGNDLALGLAAVPSQYAFAQNAYISASNVAVSLGVAPASVVITGHSLGGSLAQLLGAAHGNQTETFNAYGVGNLLSTLNIPLGSFNNITNNVMHFDPVSVFAGSNMIGKTIDYSSAIDTAFVRPEVQALAALNVQVLSMLTQHILSSHGIGNFQNASLAAQIGNLVSINIPNPLPAINQLASFLQAYSLVNLIATAFTTATLIPAPRRDPLVLDLDGDGIESTGLNAITPLMFDITGSGVKTSIGWIKPDDGFLVLDRNANGTIDGGAELFGDATPLNTGGTAVNGFIALADLDTNLDGKISSADTQFANLRVWRDLNQDGLSQSGELFTLNALNISSINLASSQTTQTLPNGNTITDLGTYVKSDGTGGEIASSSAAVDLTLAQDTFHSSFTDTIPLTAQLALLDNLLDAWADTSTLATTFEGAYSGHALTVNMQGVATGSQAYLDWQTRLSVLERFNGRTFNPVPSDPNTGTRATNDEQWGRAA
jgi:hypothetical protein